MPLSQITCHQPATHWQDALPLGNGRVGAMVYGRLADEKILLNHEKLWHGSSVSEMPDVSMHMPELRELLKDGDYSSAENFIRSKWTEQGYSFGSKTPGTPDLLVEGAYPTRVGQYQPGANLHLSQHFEGGFTRYERTLSLGSGVSQVSWSATAGNYLRENFVTDEIGCLVTSVTCDAAAAIQLKISLKPHNTDIETSFWSDHPAPRDLHWETDVDGDACTISLTVKRPEQPDYRVALCIIAKGGSVAAVGDALQVTDANEVHLFTTIRVDEAIPMAELVKLSKQDYQSLREMHTAGYEAALQGVSLELADTSSEGVKDTTDAMIPAAHANECPSQLLQSCFDFGRYLLHGSSRPGSLPANLQGIWNGDYQPAWWCGFFLNENLQMCYWSALRSGQSDSLLPVFDLLEARLDDFRENARKVFGCDGILIPVFIDHASGLKKNNQSHVIHWTGAGAWLSQFYFDYWSYTRDEEFLRERAYPFMREALAFYDDFMFEGEDGMLVSMPSNSPENKANGSFEGAGKLAISINATSDFALLKELLTNLITVGEALEVKTSKITSWQALLAKVPPYQINEDGAFKEWLHPDFKDNYHHRHLMHLYPLFPGREITRESAPEFFDACRVAVKKRKVIGLQSSTGWSLAHMAAIYARLGEGDSALECLEMLTRSCLGANLLTYHNDWRHSGITMDYFGGWRVSPFQVEANIGITNAIMEMLVFAHNDTLKLLPACPGKWPKGKLLGLRLPANRKIDLRWDQSRDSIEIDIVANSVSEPLNILLPYPMTSETLPNGAEIVSNRSFRLQVTVGETVSLRFDRTMNPKKN